MGVRTVPIIQVAPTIQMSAPSATEPMDITTPTNSSAQASVSKSPEGDVQVNANGSAGERNHSSSQKEQTHTDSMMLAAQTAAAPAVHQPKIVQTAFIHKLYKCVPERPTLTMDDAKPGGSMLEDKSIQHLISWTSTSESFVMQPSHEFSKVLAYVPVRRRPGTRC
jgi:hypothetical protein